MTILRLTYEQLADRIGRSPEAVRMLARRRHWRIVKGNDSRAVVLVEEDELVGRSPVRSPVHDRSEPPDHPDGVLVAELRQHIEGLEGDRVRLTAELVQARERAAGAEGETRALRDALADLAGRLDRAEAVLALPWWRRLLG